MLKSKMKSKKKNSSVRICSCSLLFFSFYFVFCCWDFVLYVCCLCWLFASAIHTYRCVYACVCVYYLICLTVMRCHLIRLHTLLCTGEHSHIHTWMRHFHNIVIHTQFCFFVWLSMWPCHSFCHFVLFAATAVIVATTQLNDSTVFSGANVSNGDENKIRCSLLWVRNCVRLMALISTDSNWINQIPFNSWMAFHSKWIRVNNTTRSVPVASPTEFESNAQRQ